MRHWPIALPAAVALVWWARSAEAQVATEYQVSASASIGINSNISNSADPEDDAPEGEGPEADGFGTISPAIELIFETEDVTQTLGYAFGYNYFFTHSEANAFSNTLSYSLRTGVAEGTDLVFGLTGAQSQLSVFNLVGPASGTPIQAVPEGDDYLFSGSVSQGISTELSEVIGFTQGLSFAYTRTLVADGDDLESYFASASLGLGTPLSENDTLGVGVGTDALFTPEQLNALGVLEAFHVEIIHRATGTWTHQYNPEWSSTLTLGALLGYRAEDPQDLFPQPMGSAVVAYARPPASASITVAHDVQPNLLIRQIVLAETIALRGLLYLGEGFDIGGSPSFQISRPFFFHGFGPPTYGLLIDAAVGWMPQKAPLRLELRHQYSRQFPSSGDASEGIAGTPAIQRHQGELTITFGWPDPPSPESGALLTTLGPPTSNPDILLQQVAPTDRAVDQSEREEKEERDADRDRRGGSGD